LGKGYFIVKPYLFSSDIKPEDREFIFRKAATRTGLPAYIIEKDYMVCVVLSVIFNDIKPTCLGETETPFLFKGGTSLSKVYDVINRMSEDIDLSISKKFLGYPETEDESGSKRNRRVQMLKERNTDFLATDLLSGLQKVLTTFHPDFEIFVDDQDSQSLVVNYPRSLSETDYINGYVKPHVLIETGGRALFDPHETKSIQPFVSEELNILAQIENDCQVIVDVLSIERTFFEKVTLLHELNHRGVDALTRRQARHIYDLVQIYKSRPEILKNLELLESVRSHKAKYFRRKTAKWELAEPGTLFIIPDKDVFTALKDDWLKMADLFPHGRLPYSFEEMIFILQEIDGQLNCEI